MEKQNINNTIYAKELFKTELGKIFNLDDSYTIYDKTIKIIDKDTCKCVAIFLKNVMKDEKLLKAGRNMLVYKKASIRRANASGERNFFIPKSGHDKPVHLGASVNSSIVGYADADNYHPCRQTALYRKHKELFDTETKKVVQEISKLFKIYCPVEYELQENFIKECNQNLVINDTVYTTLTINHDWQTACHTDKGDFEAGLGNLTVFNYDNFNGGEIMFPTYKIAFNIQEGDVLFMDVHKPHCNNKLEGKGRIGLVCYAREQIKVRCSQSTKEDIENPVSYRNREKRPTGLCTNCGQTESPIWRYTNDDKCLCNSCGLQLKLKGILPVLSAPKPVRTRRKRGILSQNL